MSFDTIIPEIKALLDSLKAWTTLNEVYDYPLPSTDNFPHAVIERETRRDDFLDSVSNQVTYTFVIRLFDQDTDSQAMEARLSTLVDDIYTELRKKTNITLNGDAVSFKISNTEWTWVEEAQFPMRLVNMFVEARSIESIV